MTASSGNTPFGATSTADDVLAGRDLAGKRYLVTGASSGIGLETARALVAHDATVVGSSTKSPVNAEQATQTLRHAAENGGGRFETIQIDLGSLASIREQSKALLAHGERFDAIIANAGVMGPPLGRTVDGFELQFGINFLGHFALMLMLEPLIADGGRIVILSSQAHRVSDIDLDDLNFDHQAYDPFISYGRSKTADTLLAVELDRRLRHRGIGAASVMPGNSITNLPRYFSQERLESLFETVAKSREAAGLSPAKLKEIPQAAETSVWAAVVADNEAIRGKYLEDCAAAPINDSDNPFADGVRSYALDPERAAALCEKSERLLATI
ncbi:MAG: SDR family NAD(P)-dependent oxidoreductase [Microvirga sp.]|nr:SDR family NAD(P)-dependent oxidoreductase [Microvirga sp.]